MTTSRETAGAVAGLDLGSRTTKLVVLEQGRIVAFRITDTGPDMAARAVGLLEGFAPARTVATGYGRNLVAKSASPTATAAESLAAVAEFADEVVTEITAYAFGARHLFPACRTVIDVGGQDSKVIALDDRGGFRDFEMNDRCAAGTGRFLEVMARALGFDLESFGPEACKAAGPVAITSVCTVFAESEVISLLARGEDVRGIALGIHQAIVDRLSAMVQRVGARPEVVFAGGVARNPCIGRLLAERLGLEIRIPENPQMVGALGAALRAEDTI
jgi:predicted CoA-substrate-specific enzyme activase